MQVSARGYPFSANAADVISTRSSCRGYGRSPPQTRYPRVESGEKFEFEQRPHIQRRGTSTGIEWKCKCGRTIRRSKMRLAEPAQRALNAGVSLRV